MLKRRIKLLLELEQTKLALINAGRYRLKEATEALKAEESAADSTNAETSENAEEQTEAVEVAENTEREAENAEIEEMIKQAEMESESKPEEEHNVEQS